MRICTVGKRRRLPEPRRDRGRLRRGVVLRMRAERRCGELLAELERATPQQVAKAGGHAKARTVQPATVAVSSPYRETIERTGISPRTAQRYQRPAA